MCIGFLIEGIMKKSICFIVICASMLFTGNIKTGTYVDSRINIDIVNNNKISRIERIKWKLQSLSLDNPYILSHLLEKIVMEEDENDIITIIYLESRGDTLAYSKGNYGLMQINEIHLKTGTVVIDSLFNAEYNLRSAYEKIYLPYCKKHYENRFIRYNGSSRKEKYSAYAKSIVRNLEKIDKENKK